MPLQAPVLALSVWPSFVVPEIFGSSVLAGARATTTALWAEVAGAEELAALVAMTATRRVEPTSPWTRT